MSSDVGHRECKRWQGSVDKAAMVLLFEANKSQTQPDYRTQESSQEWKANV